MNTEPEQKPVIETGTKEELEEMLKSFPKKEAPGEIFPSRHGETAQPILPTEDQIEETIQLINDRLDLPEIDLPKNAAVKEGYEEAVDILVLDKRKLEDTNIRALKTIQGRFIAGMALDYLLGDCKQDVLVNVPIKGVVNTSSKEQEEKAWEMINGAKL